MRLLVKSDVNMGVFWLELSKFSVECIVQIFNLESTKSLKITNRVPVNEQKT